MIYRATAPGMTNATMILNMQLKLPLVNPLQAIRIPEHMPSLFSLVVTSRPSQIQPPLLPVPLLLVGTCSTKAPDTTD
ncbi:MAG TPA: hypothetical protein VEL70_02555 [Candidatus Acidoferrum sp.]|nr:hypothetical protein [Candidatus Acidoferrum sp.]